jgi:purine-nucleoside phosphorylase
MNDSIQRLRNHHAETAVVLGSGLNSLAGDAKRDEAVLYANIPEIPAPTVPGHAGRFVLAQMNGTRLIFAQGRVHLYEGFSAHEVTSIVRVLAGAGIKQLILTNAAGALNPGFKPGDWMMITDHINLTGASPLVATSPTPASLSPSAAGRGCDTRPTFLDMIDAYSPRLREKFRQAARKIGMTLHEGVYAGNIGPQYETPAEVRMLQKLGADAVGMSTVLETIEARALGCEVAGLSCITNLAAGISTEKLSHEEVLETGRKAAAQFAALLKAALLPGRTRLGCR